MSERSARRGRRVLIAVVVTGVVVALSGAAYAALHSRYLSATVIEIRGAYHETPAAIAAATGLSSAPPLIDVDPGVIAARVVADFPWVRAAAVTRHWPHTVDVVITERRAVAAVTTPRGGEQLVDASGARLGAAPAGTVLPMLSAAGMPVSSSGALPAVATPGLTVASTLPPAFAWQVASVTVDPRGWVRLALRTPITFDLGAATNLGAKYEDIAAVIARAVLHAGDVVDVSVPQAVTVSGP